MSVKRVLSHAVLVTAMAFVLVVPPWARSGDASSHREAPLISMDPSADNTDLYAFRSPDNPSTVTILANYIPLQPAYGGPNFFNPADDVLYSIKIDNDGDANPDIFYRFRFQTTEAPSAVGGGAGDTFLYNDGPITTSPTDPNLLVRTTYTLTRVDVPSGGSPTSSVIATGRVVPAFVGKQSYCSGDPAPCSEATAKAEYENVAAAAIVNTSEGGKAFVGPRRDAFYVDLGKAFDLARLGPLPPGYGTPINNVGEFNTTTLAIQVPINKLTAGGDPVIGVWATAERRASEVIRANNVRDETGPFRQVSRLGSPLVNEVVIGRKDKDKFNATNPDDDVANFGGYVVNPRLPKILNALYPGLGAKTTNRGDLVQIFVTGIPNLTRPANLTRGGEMLRLRTSTPVTPAASRSDLGVLGGDPQGFPNGRRPTDDVFDIALRAAAFQSCSGPNEGFGATLPCTGPALGDGVDKSGLAFLAAFPYLPTPLSGTQP